LQQGWDDLDRTILNSAPDIEVDRNYNYKLRAKINKRNYVKNQSRSAAYSLIMAGFMLFIMYTSNVQYEILDIKYKVETEVLMFINNFNFENIFLGE
jgi:hypothetical protein